MIDLETGRMIWQRIRKCPAPSIVAASERAAGTWEKEVRMMMILYATQHPGMISDQ